MDRTGCARRSGGSPLRIDRHGGVVCRSGGWRRRSLGRRRGSAFGFRFGSQASAGVHDDGGSSSEEPDPEFGPQIRFASQYKAIAYAMNNSFGFGGNNCSLLFGVAA